MQIWEFLKRFSTFSCLWNLFCKTVLFLMNLHRFGFYCCCWWRKRFWMLPEGFEWRLRTESLGETGSWFCFCCFHSWIRKRIVFLLFSLEPVQLHLLFLLLLCLAKSPLWSCLDSPLVVDLHLYCRGGDSMMKIQPWISENPPKTGEFRINLWYWNF